MTQIHELLPKPEGSSMEENDVEDNKKHDSLLVSYIRISVMCISKFKGFG